MATAEALLENAQGAAGLWKQLPWLVALRERGADAFRERGLPTTRDEAWKYTSLVPLQRAALAGGAEALRPDAFAGTTAIRMVAGVTGDDSSPQPGVRVGSLAKIGFQERDARVEAALGSVAKLDDALDALNAASLVDGAVILVDDGVDVALPIHIVHTSDGAQASPRNLIVVGKNSRVRVIEQWLGGDHAYLVNPVTEVVVGENSTVEHVKLQQDGREAFHLGALHVQVGRDATFRGWSLSIGARIARTRIEVGLGTGSNVELTGLYLGAEGQTHDHHTTVRHDAPHARSRELFKGILDSGSRGVFTGRIVVAKDAQKTDSGQQVRNLLLGDDAIANARPQLEILADDVKCAHGAAVGRLEEEALFYLRSRGLPLVDARKLLTLAFASEVVASVPEAARPAVEALVEGWLGRLEAE